jgi:hypothetical protein
MDLEPATFAQVRRARDGRVVLIEDDVLGVVADIQRIDPTLRVRYAEAGEYFVVYQLCDHDGDERLVTTSQTFDQRLVERIRQITHESYDLAGELAREDDRRDRERDHEFSEQVGEIGERLFHAMRKDKGRTDTAFVKEGL